MARGGLGQRQLRLQLRPGRGHIELASALPSCNGQGESALQCRFVLLKLAHHPGESVPAKARSISGEAAMEAASARAFCMA